MRGAEIGFKSFLAHHTKKGRNSLLLRPFAFSLPVKNMLKCRNTVGGMELLDTPAVIPPLADLCQKNSGLYD